jgi:hypothetical protein
MQGFVNHKPKPYVPRSRQNLLKHPSGADYALLLTGFSYSCVDACASRCTVAQDEALAHRAGNRVKPAKVSGGKILLPDLGD